MRNIAFLMLFFSTIQIYATETKITINSQRIYKNEEKILKYKLERQQSELLITKITDMTYRYHYGKRKYNDIRKIVETSYEMSFKFKNLGDDHIERFIRILGWVEWETGFRKNMISSWKKGQVVNRGGVRQIIKKNCKDYGAWQVNDQHFKMYSRKVNIFNGKNYKSDMIYHMNDFIDIRNNCIARCMIEEDRKKMNLEWKHDHAIKYLNKVEKEIKKLEEKSLYDKNLSKQYRQ
jgi:hypothetical protein